jgi:hypothetical protein
MKTSVLGTFLLASTLTAQTYSLQDFGRQCGGDLQGTVVTTPNGTGLRLAVTGAMPNAIAILVVGHPQPAPVQLPGSNCTLLVDPRVTLLAMTDAQGQAGFTFRVPPVLPIRIDFQVAVADFVRGGRVVESTDGVRLLGR